jgi:hypothetical protein
VVPFYVKAPKITADSDLGSDTMDVDVGEITASGAHIFPAVESEVSPLHLSRVLPKLDNP